MLRFHFISYEFDICGFVAFQAFSRRLKKSLSQWRTPCEILEGGGGGDFQHVCESFKYNAWYIKLIV